MRDYMLEQMMEIDPERTMDCLFERDNYSEAKRTEERRWRTRDGEEISLSLMETSHIINCINYFKNRGYVAPSTLSFYLGCTPPTADGASLAFEQEFDQICDAPLLSWLDWWNEELERRGEKRC